MFRGAGWLSAEDIVLRECPVSVLLPFNPAAMTAPDGFVSYR